jgi:hypothetical protein
MIKILVQVIPKDESAEPNEPVETSVPVMPKRGDFFKIQEDGRLSPSYIVSDIIFVEDRWKCCSVLVCLKTPAS